MINGCAWNGRLGWTIVALLAASASLGAPAAHAQTSCVGWVASPETAMPGFSPSTAYRGLALDIDGDGPQPERFYLAGRITTAGSQRARGIIQWDGAEWSSVGRGLRFDAGDGEAYALCAFRGGLVVGGYFTQADEIPASNIARWDGSQWHAIGNGLDWSVLTVTEFNGELIAGGAFGFNGAGSPSGIARWDGASWRALESGVDGWVRAMTIYNGDLVVCGEFARAGGISSRGVAAWNGTAWRTLGGGLDGTVYSAATWKGKLYVSGTFRFAGGVAVPGLAVWDGAVWKPVFPDGSGGGVAGVFGEDLVISRELSESYPGLNSPVVHRVALWDGTSLRGPSSRDPLNGWVVGVFKDELVLVNCTLQSPWSVTGPVTWNRDRVRPLASGLTEVVGDLQVFGNEVVATGRFRFAGPHRVDSIVRWDGAGWRPFPAVDAFDVQEAGAMAALGDILVVNRSVRTGPDPFDPSQYHSFLAWDGVRWQDLGGSPSGTAEAMLAAGGNLYAAGAFGLEDPDRDRPGVIVWDGSRWSRLASSSPDGFTVAPTCLAMFRGALHASGRSVYSGSPGDLNFARWDGMNWVPAGPGLSGQVTDMVVYRDELIVAGRLLIDGHPEIRMLARWDGSQWRSLGADMPKFYDTGNPHLVVHNDQLVVACPYLMPGTWTARHSLSRWNGTTWEVFAEGFVSFWSVLESFQGELIVGPSFFKSFYPTVGDSYFARWSDTGGWVAHQPAHTSVPAGRSTVLSARLASGYSSSSIRWTRDGVEVSDGPGGAAPGGGEVVGSHTSELVIRHLSFPDAGTYRAEFSTDCGVVLSEPASLRVLTPCVADLDDDRVVDDRDFAIFVRAYSISECDDPAMATNCPADFDHDGRVTELDFAVFLGAYDVLVCPE